MVIIASPLLLFHLQIKKKKKNRSVSILMDSNRGVGFAFDFECVVFEEMSEIRIRSA